MNSLWKGIHCSPLFQNHLFVDFLFIHFSSNACFRIILGDVVERPLLRCVWTRHLLKRFQEHLRRVFGRQNSFLLSFNLASFFPSSFSAGGCPPGSLDPEAGVFQAWTRPPTCGGLGPAPAADAECVRLNVTFFFRKLLRYSFGSGIFLPLSTQALHPQGSVSYYDEEKGLLFFQGWFSWLNPDNLCSSLPQKRRTNRRFAKGSLVTSLVKFFPLADVVITVSQACLFPQDDRGALASSSSLELPLAA